MEEMSGEQPQPDASFHDIGKIVNWEAVGLRERRPDGTLEKDPHEFEKCISHDDWSSPEWHIDPSATPWQSILTWHKLWKDRWSGSMHRWHAKPADWLASGYGRGEQSEDVKEYGKQIRKSLPYKPGRYCLWTGIQSEDKRLSTERELRELIAHLNSSPSWEETEERYHDELATRAEEAAGGFNVTSVLAHCRIVGKLARVLAKAEWKGAAPEANPKKKSVTALNPQPKLVAFHFRLSFLQRPFRARDLGIFQNMQSRLQAIAEKFSDNVLTIAGFEGVAVFESYESKGSFIKALENEGFVICGQVVNRCLNEYLPSEAASRSIMVVLDEPWYPVSLIEWPERIELPICESCQMAQATKHWPKDHLAEMDGWSDVTLGILKSQAWRDIDASQVPEADREELASWLEEYGEEDLCENCYRLRKETPPVKLLRDWDKDVLYIRFALDIERLAGHSHRRTSKRDSCLEYLHKQYLRESGNWIPQSMLDNLFVTFPIVADFVNDYKAFLHAVQRELENQFADRTAILSEELCCLGLENRNELFDVIETVSGAFSKAFPKLLELPTEVDNPISIALSLSKKKHPFFDHWRFLEQPPHDVAVLVIGSGEARFRLADYEKIKKALEGAKPSQLHKLAAAAGISESLGKLVLYEQDNRGIVLSEFSKLVPDVLEFESARVLANLMEG